MLAAISFEAGGGTVLGPTTTVEMALTLAGGAVVAIAMLRAPRPHAAAALGVGLLIALAVLTTASIVWSESPSDSWLEASRAFAYAAFFAAAVSGARLVPQRWASVLGGLLVAGAAVCGYALLTKVFPGALDANDTYSRLRAPFGYWNAVGLIAALTVIASLWLGSRREGNPAISALAYPLAGIALVVLMLAYSRGSLFALAIGCVVWFAAAPRRLRSAAVLLTAIAGAAPAVAWAFGQPVLTQDRIDASMRAGAGHDLGLLVLVLALVLMAAGLAIGFFAERNPISVLRRDQLGLALVIAVALIPVGVAGGLALSSRGLPGSISHAWTKLTDPHAKTPPNTPSRLTGVASVRAQYWNEALKVGADHPRRRRRGRLRGRPPALPQRQPDRAPRPWIRRADVRRPGGRGAGAQRRPARGLGIRGAGRHKTVRVDAAAPVAGACARSEQPCDRGAGADGPAVPAGLRGRVRGAFDHRLDLVDPR